MNSTPPKKSSVSEAEECEMEEFIDNVKLVVSTLAHKDFEPLFPVIQVEKEIREEISSENIYINNNKGLMDTGIVASDGFIVLKGSDIN